MTQLVSLAADDTFDKNKVTPGVLGFLVFAALAIGVWALMKSMNRHMGKVSFQETPDPDAPVAGPEGGEGRAKAAAGTAPAEPSGPGSGGPDRGPGKKK
ncbi:hypothetical protein ACQPZG_13050 [Streptomyces sp. CA-294286]|uniref:hypothetical protein n=1 Tax=Streptomyces sp. CA-294286 TaxID=3240070 RepID=UPI003D93FCBF